MQRCGEKKVLLRHFGGDLDDCIRISIGTPEENSKLLRALDMLKEDRNA
jgi:histidinol-phosphate/aromatic aminotransferase/cobyric acid decarboxylase-like protein